MTSTYFYYLGEAGNEQKLSLIGLAVNGGREEISQETRLASAKLVRDVVAVKRSWSFSYEFLTGQTSGMEDGGLGRDALKTLFDAGGTLSLKVPLEAGSYETVAVMFGGQFSEQRVKSWPFYAWAVSFELKEI